MQWWDEAWGSYDTWAMQQLNSGTWGDDFTLQVARCHFGFPGHWGLFTSSFALGGLSRKYPLHIPTLSVARRFLSGLRLIWEYFLKEVEVGACKSSFEPYLRLLWTRPTSG